MNNTLYNHTTKRAEKEEILEVFSLLCRFFSQTEENLCLLEYFMRSKGNSETVAAVENHRHTV